MFVPSNILFVQFFVDHKPTNNLGFFLTYRHVENSLLHVMTTAANIRTNTSYSRTVSPAANSRPKTTAQSMGTVLASVRSGTKRTTAYSRALTKNAFSQLMPTTAYSRTVTKTAYSRTKTNNASSRTMSTAYSRSKSTTGYSQYVSTSTYNCLWQFSTNEQPTTDIMQTSPCNEYPLTPHFYIVTLGFTGVYLIFLFLL